MTWEKEPRLTIYIPPREGRAVTVRKGEYVQLIDLQGKQVGDLIAYNSYDPSEYLSPPHMRICLGHIAPQLGKPFYTNRRRPIFTLVEDTVGRHDTLAAPCDRERYLYDYGIEGHANCRDNLLRALRPYGISRPPDSVVNVFQNTPVLPDGTISVEEPLSRPGDYILLRVEMDAIVAVSACPQDQNPLNGWQPTDLMLIVFPAHPGRPG
jgi:uncharacterized protein YcgI (DUF1989 family)